MKKMKSMLILLIVILTTISICTAEDCDRCHQDIVANFTTSLHHTGSGMGITVGEERHPNETLYTDGSGSASVAMSTRQWCTARCVPGSDWECIVCDEHWFHSEDMLIDFQVKEFEPTPDMCRLDFLVFDMEWNPMSGVVCRVGGKACTTHGAGACSIEVECGKSYTARCDIPSGYTCGCDGCRCEDGPFIPTGNGAVETFFLKRVTEPEPDPDPNANAICTYAYDNREGVSYTISRMVGEDLVRWVKIRPTGMVRKQITDKITIIFVVSEYIGGAWVEIYEGSHHEGTITTVATSDTSLKIAFFNGNMNDGTVSIRCCYTPEVKCNLNISLYDETEQGVKDAVFTYDGEWNSHTITSEGKDCVFCHENPDVLGQGLKGQIVGEGGQLIPQTTIDRILSADTSESEKSGLIVQILSLFGIEG